MEISSNLLIAIWATFTLLAQTSAQWLGLGIPFLPFGLLPNPLALWALGGPGIGAQIPDDGLMGMNDTIRDLPQQNPPAAAPAVTTTSTPVADSTSVASKSSNDSSADDKRSINKNTGSSSNAIISPSRLSILDKNKILNFSISALAKQIISEQPVESTRLVRKTAKATTKSR